MLISILNVSHQVRLVDTTVLTVFTICVKFNLGHLSHECYKQMS